MTAYEVVTLADELAPNVFSNTVKLFELNRLEQRIRVDILKEDPADVTPFTAEDLTAPASVLGSWESGQIDDPTPGGGGNAGGGEGGGDGEITDPTNPPITGEGDDPGTGGDSGGTGSGDDSGSGSDDSGGTGSGSDDSGSGDESGSGSGADSEGGDDSEDETPAGTLALEERYRDVYVFWMVSMYYYHMGEYEEYQNKKAMFEAVWTRFERDVCTALDRAGGYA